VLLFASLARTLDGDREGSRPVPAQPAGSWLSSWGPGSASTVSQDP
jgi:hypothetical protein